MLEENNSISKINESKIEEEKEQEQQKEKEQEKDNNNNNNNNDQSSLSSSNSSNSSSTLQQEKEQQEVNNNNTNTVTPLNSYTEEELQQIYNEAVIKFNIKPKTAKDFLILKKVIKGEPSEIAEFIQKNSKLSKRRIGEYIGNNDEFNQKVCDELFSRYNFGNKTLDSALRILLLQFRLPGEAQQIDRILEKFATHYHLQNPGVFLNSDTAYVLAFSIIMLNTDLHNQSIIPEKKMTLEQFIKNNRGINQGQDVSRDLLVTLYNSVKENEIRMEETDMYESEVVAFMAPTKSGWLSKKKEGLLEFTSWKRYWFVLNDGCLYYFTDPSDEGPTCIIPLDNVKPMKNKNELEIMLTSSIAGDYIKSSKVLEDGRMEQGRHIQLTFRCESIEERDSWVKVLQEEALRFKPLHEIFLRRREELNPINVTPIIVPQTPLNEGWTRIRWNSSRIGWRRRYVVLYPDFDGEGNTVFYYVSQQLASRMKEFGTQTQQGYIRMKDVVSLEHFTPSNGFPQIHIKTDDNRILQLIPDDPEQFDSWYDTLYHSLVISTPSLTNTTSINQQK